MRRHLRSLDTVLLLRTLLKVMISGAVLAAVAWAGMHFWLSDWATLPFAPKALRLLVVIAASGTAFLLAALLLRIEELKVIVASIRRRVARPRAS
jgi:peptidoglycan biosynthesis protein MviN/MurJ (putative lipid II flippase)